MKPYLLWQIQAYVRLAMIVVGTGAAFGAQPEGESPRRHLFLDPSFLLETERVTLQVNPPAEGEQVIRPDRPWERMWIPFYTTVRDEGGKLRMWYNCRDGEGRSNLAYAESIDGKNWTKPNLGVVDYEGNTSNNLVGVQSLEGAVYRDPQGTRDAQYIYVTSLHKGGGVFRFTSPDGLRWKRDAEPLLPFECDSQNVTFWDTMRNKYVLYLRGWGPKDARDNRRTVVRIEAESLNQPLNVKPSARTHHESGDLQRQPWIDGEAPVVLACDLRDPPGTDVYTNAIQSYPLDPRWYVGFPALYRHFSGSPHRTSDGWTEVQFVGSRDGIRWHRYGRDVYAGPGFPGLYSGSMIFMGTGMAIRGDEIWQYGTRYRTTHGDTPGRQRQMDGAIYRFIQRVDGFISADFAAEGGSCRTAGVKVDGPRLALNLNAGGLGQLRVGLLDAEGKAISGFALEECKIMRLNSTRAQVSWNGGGNLAALQGRTVQLLFTGSRAKLYSFYFVADTP
jgi:hypothetical protein